MKVLRAIKRLRNPRDFWLFLQILIFLVRLPRQIRKRSLPDLLSAIDPGVTPRAPDRALLDKTVGFTDSLLRYRMFQRYGKCLLRSMVLFRFLRRQGWPVEIHFGVRKSSDDSDAAIVVDAGHHAADNSITGHSWLVLNGEVFLEDAHHAGGYAETFAFSGN